MGRASNRKKGRLHRVVSGNLKKVIDVVKPVGAKTIRSQADFEAVFQKTFGHAPSQPQESAQ